MRSWPTRVDPLRRMEKCGRYVVAWGAAKPYGEMRQALETAIPYGRPSSVRGQKTYENQGQGGRAWAGPVPASCRVSVADESSTSQSSDMSPPDNTPVSRSDPCRVKSFRLLGDKQLMAKRQYGMTLGKMRVARTPQTVVCPCVKESCPRRSVFPAFLYCGRRMREMCSGQAAVLRSADPGATARCPTTLDTGGILRG